MVLLGRKRCCLLAVICRPVDMPENFHLATYQLFYRRHWTQESIALGCTTKQGVEVGRYWLGGDANAHACIQHGYGGLHIVIRNDKCDKTSTNWFACWIQNFSRESHSSSKGWYWSSFVQLSWLKEKWIQLQQFIGTFIIIYLLTFWDWTVPWVHIVSVHAVLVTLDSGCRAIFIYLNIQERTDNWHHNRWQTVTSGSFKHPSNYI